MHQTLTIIVVFTNAPHVYSPKVLSALCDGVHKLLLQWGDKGTQVSTLQGSPDLIITVVLKRVKIHPQVTRKEHWILHRWYDTLLKSIHVHLEPKLKQASIIIDSSNVFRSPSEYSWQQHIKKCPRQFISWMFVHLYIPYMYLWDDGDLWPQVFQSETGNVNSINKDGASGWLNDPEQSQSERWLSCTSTTHYTNLKENQDFLRGNNCKHMHLSVLNKSYFARIKTLSMEIYSFIAAITLVPEGTSHWMSFNTKSSPSR